MAKHSVSHKNSNFAAVVLKILYDIDVEDEDDVYVEISEQALAGAVEGLVPGKFLVEFLPFLRHVPSWLPGATSQRLWEKWMAAGERLKNVPFNHTKTKLVCVILWTIYYFMPSNCLPLTPFRIMEKLRNR